MKFLKVCFIQNKTTTLKSVCPTMITSVRSCSAMESVRNSCGLNTWRTAAPTAMSHLCIPSSATTSNRMSRNDVLQCTSAANPVSRSRLTGQVILQQSLTRITAALRNEQFFSLAELNHAIREKLEQFNRRLFQKKEGSRLDLFLEDEKPLLSPLPATRFELSDWKTATVQFNYHISVDGMLYSVPYEYIKKKVDVKVTDPPLKFFTTITALLPTVV